MINCWIEFWEAPQTQTSHLTSYAQLLRRMGFEERIRGRHHIFRKAGVEERVSLQREGSKAKIYQVRQVRSVILKYGLGGEDHA